MKKIKGFTLIELLVTLSVVGILASIAVPSLLQTVKNNRMVSTINAMQGSFMYAKGEAIGTGQAVSLCKRNTAGTNCDNSKNWEDGWIVFRDVNENGVIDSPDCTDMTKDCILRIHESLNADMMLRSNGSIVDSIRFDSRGFAKSTTGVFSLCDTRGVTHALGTKIALTGILKRLTDTDADGINDDNGANLTCP